MNSTRDTLPDTPAFLAEREALPECLRGPFDNLVEMYRYYALIHYAKPFVSYKILADLVREGWRPSAEPVSSPKDTL